MESGGALPPPAPHGHSYITSAAFEWTQTGRGAALVLRGGGLSWSRQEGLGPRAQAQEWPLSAQGHVIRHPQRARWGEQLGAVGGFGRGTRRKGSSPCYLCSQGFPSGS